MLRFITGRVVSTSLSYAIGRTANRVQNPTTRFFHAKSRVFAKSIENTYVKKTQIEHVLERPDTYVGTTEKIAKVCSNNYY
jgi:hypothetical protein